MTKSTIDRSRIKLLFDRCIGYGLTDVAECLEELAAELDAANRSFRMLHDLGVGQKPSAPAPMEQYPLRGDEPVGPQAARADYVRGWNDCCKAFSVNAPRTGGFSAWMTREEWGAVIDGLMLERDRSDRQKADNPDSTSNVRSEMSSRLIHYLRKLAESSPL